MSYLEQDNVDDHRVAGVIAASIPAPSATSVHHFVMSRIALLRIGFPFAVINAIVCHFSDSFFINNQK